ncbi:unnamed protein product, partial [Ectocarpus sp. 4 AP-2014]
EREHDASSASKAAAKARQCRQSRRLDDDVVHIKLCGRLPSAKLPFPIFSSVAARPGQRASIFRGCRVLGPTRRLRRLRRRRLGPLLPQSLKLTRVGELHSRLLSSRLWRLDA